MSRITNPEIEQSVSCGFYNALSSDRRYDAVQMSKIFDGIINDGVFASIGTCFAVKANSGNTVNVGIGKCWFNHTWTENDAVLPVDCGESEVLLNRIDAVVIRVDSSEAVRDNFIEVKKGTPASNPARPTLTNNNLVHEHALCYIYRAAGSTEITQSNITNVVGTSETPFVTGILQVISLDELLGQWEDDLNRFMASKKQEVNKFIQNEEADFDAFMTKKENEYDEWYSQMKTLMADAVAEVDTWTEAQKATILDWFEGMRDQLSEDSAINLQLQIDKCEIERILMDGFGGCQKTISDDGTVITSVSKEGQTLTKTFTNGFLTCTTVLTDVNGTELGRMVKNFSSDGKTIDSDIDIYIDFDRAGIDTALDNIINLQNEYIGE